MQLHIKWEFAQSKSSRGFAFNGINIYYWASFEEAKICKEFYIYCCLNDIYLLWSHLIFSIITLFSSWLHLVDDKPLRLCVCVLGGFVCVSAFIQRMSARQSSEQHFGSRSEMSIRKLIEEVGGEWKCLKEGGGMEFFSYLSFSARGHRSLNWAISQRDTFCLLEWNENICLLTTIVRLCSCYSAAVCLSPAEKADWRFFTRVICLNS